MAKKKTDKTDSAVKKQRKKVTKKSARGKTDHLKDHQFKAGQSGNPAGRAKGSRNKFAAAFIDDFYKDWQKDGAKAVQEVRKKDPAAYLRIGASLIPKEFTFKDNSDEAVDALLDRIDESELPDLVAGLIALGRQEDQTQNRQQADQEEAGSKSNSIH